MEDAVMTGVAAERAGTTEVYVQQLIRWGKIEPPPKRGRVRMWPPAKVAELGVVVERNRK